MRSKAGMAFEKACWVFAYMVSPRKFFWRLGKKLLGKPSLGRFEFPFEGRLKGIFVC